MPSVTRMSPTIRLETRWVWPTIIASTVVSWSALAMSRIGPTHGAPGGVADRVEPDVRALVDDHDLDLHAQLAQALGFGLDPGRLGQERQPGRGAGRDELGRVLELGADDADLDAVDGEHDRRRDPDGRLAGRGLDDVRGQEREVRAVPAARAAGSRRSRTRGCRTTWRRGPRRSRRRSSACPPAARSSAARRRRCRRRPGSARARAAPRGPRRTWSPAGRPRRPGRSWPSMVVVVGLS